MSPLLNKKTCFIGLFALVAFFVLRSPLVGLAHWIDAHASALSLIVTTMVYIDQKIEARQLRLMQSELEAIHDEQRFGNGS